MWRNSLTGLDRKTLRRWLAVFFLALAIPTGILVYQAYSQLKWEAFHQYRVLAEELAARIDARIIALINTEEARSFADYAFLNVAGDPAANFLQRSPLSAYPHASPIPGLVGYFQVDTEGAFTTPLVPPAGTVASTYGIAAGELQQRLALQQQIEQILSRNRLVQDSKTGRVTGAEAATDALPAETTRRDRQAGLAAPSLAKDALQRRVLEDEAVPATAERAERAEQQAPGQAAFDRLNKAAAPREQEQKQQPASVLGRVEDLQLDYRYQSESADADQRTLASNAPAVAKRARKERSALPEPADESGARCLRACARPMHRNSQSLKAKSASAPSRARLIRSNSVGSTVAILCCSARSGVMVSVTYRAP